MQYKFSDFERAFHLLNNELNRLHSTGYNLIICGGSALNAANLIHRTTKWSMSHDISDAYRVSVKSFLKESGYEKAAEQI